MKNTILAALLLLTPSLSYAVRAGDCPQTIKIDMGSVTALSVDQIISGSNDRLDEDDAKDVTPIRDLLFNVRSIKTTATLKEASSAYCVYLPEGETKTYGDNEIRLVRKGGRDVLRIAKYLGETPSRFLQGRSDKQNVWVYVNVAKYSKDGIEITPTRGAKVYAWFDHGSPIIQFGWANDITVN